MKKLLLSIAPLLLLFGGCFATDEVISSYVVNTPYQDFNAGYIIGQAFYVTNSGTTMPEFYVSNHSTNGTGCNKRILYKTGVVIDSGTYTYGVYTVATNSVLLYPGTYYSIGLLSTVGNCTLSRSNESQSDGATALAVGRLGGLLWGMRNNTSDNGLTITRHGMLSGIKLSYIPPAVGVTIRYNGISTGFAGSNIYLLGINSTVAMSGTDIKFTYLQNIFRALFRSNP